MEIWCECVCVRCATTTAGRYVLNGRIPQREIRKEAEHHRWVLNNQGEWFCAVCAHKMEMDRKDAPS